jgi:hypothetical protein
MFEFSGVKSKELYFFNKSGLATIAGLNPVIVSFVPPPSFPKVKTLSLTGVGKSAKLPT